MKGFIFEDQLLHSTDRVNVAEPVEIAYFMLQRKDYGPYTIVIAIPKATFENYSASFSSEGDQPRGGHHYHRTIFGDNDELSILSPQSISWVISIPYRRVI